MTKYDPSIIGQFADELYGRATLIVVLWTVGFGLLGLVAGFAFGGAIAVLLALVGAGLGFVVGQQRVFMMRLWAQLALLMVQVETNTRTHPPSG